MSRSPAWLIHFRNASILAVFLIGMFWVLVIAHEPHSREDEENRVYSTILNDIATFETELILTDQTWQYASFDDIIAVHDHVLIHDEAVEDLIRGNGKSEPIPNDLHVFYPLRILSESEIEPFLILNDELLQTEHIILVTVSSIGFNEKLTHALVGMSYYCGGECGSFKLYELIRIGDSWMILAENELITW